MSPVTGECNLPPYSLLYGAAVGSRRVLDGWGIQLGDSSRSGCCWAGSLWLSKDLRADLLCWSPHRGQSDWPPLGRAQRCSGLIQMLLDCGSWTRMRHLLSARPASMSMVTQCLQSVSWALAHKLSRLGTSRSRWYWVHTRLTLRVPLVLLPLPTRTLFLSCSEDNGIFLWDTLSQASITDGLQCPWLPSYHWFGTLRGVRSSSLVMRVGLSLVDQGCKLGCCSVNTVPLSGLCHWTALLLGWTQAFPRVWEPSPQRLGESCYSVSA